MFIGRTMIISLFKKDSYCFERSISDFAHRHDDTNLLKGAEEIGENLALGDLAIFDAVNDKAGGLGLGTGRRDPMKSHWGYPDTCIAYRRIRQSRR